MKEKNIIIVVVLIGIVILLIMGCLFIGMPLYLNSSARKTLEEVVATSSEVNEDFIETQLSNQEREIFNQKFASYETEDGEALTALNVLALFSIIQINNSQDNARIIDVNGTIITKDNIDSFKSVIKEDAKYKIKCIYGDDGYIKTIELRYTN